MSLNGFVWKWTHPIVLMLKSKDLSMISFPQPIVKFAGIYQSWLGATVLNVIKNIFLAKKNVTNIPLYRIQSRIQFPMISHEIPYSVNPRFSTFGKHTMSKSPVFRQNPTKSSWQKLVLHLHSAEHRCSAGELPQKCCKESAVKGWVFSGEKARNVCGCSFSGTDILVGMIIIIQNLINMINHGVLSLRMPSGFSQKGNVHFIKDGV